MLGLVRLGLDFLAMLSMITFFRWSCFWPAYTFWIAIYWAFLLLAGIFLNLGSLAKSLNLNYVIIKSYNILFHIMIGSQGQI